MDKLIRMKLSINKIIKSINIDEFFGDKDTIITNIKKLDSDVESMNKNSLYWCSDKNIALLNLISTGTCIISQNAFNNLKKENKLINTVNLLIVDNPRLTFLKILKLFFIKKEEFGFVSDSARIHKSVKYNPAKVIIEHNVVIEKNAIIGDYVKIGYNTVIKSNTIIEDNVTLGSNNTIGGTGFGYEINEKGKYELIPHIGNVILKKGVEIGNNTCIDRAVLGSTILNKNVKVDNLVHIAHGVVIGENSVIIANSMIAGSVHIGKNVWVSPSSSIIQKVKIDDNTLVGMGSVVLKNVEKNQVVAGVPAKKINHKT